MVILTAWFASWAAFAAWFTVPRVSAVLRRNAELKRAGWL